jgi:hypothetical protein
MNMKIISQRLAVFILSVVVVPLSVLASAGELWANPDWVEVKYTGWTVRTVKGKGATTGGHLRLVLKFNITNRSKKGDIITAIYDRKITWNGTASVPTLVYRSRSGYSPEESMIIEAIKYNNLKYSGSFSEPIKGEWYPGQTYKYELSVNMNKLIKPTESWKATNDGWKRDNSKFAMKKYSFNFQVRSHR